MYLQSLLVTENIYSSEPSESFPENFRSYVNLIDVGSISKHKAPTYNLSVKRFTKLGIILDDIGSTSSIHFKVLQEMTECSRVKFTRDM